MGRAQQEQSDVRSPLSEADHAEGEAPRKQVRFADSAAADNSSNAAALLHAADSLHRNAHSSAAGEHRAVQQNEFAAEAPDMADDGWEVPNTYPVDPNGCELLPSEPPAAPTRPFAVLEEPPGRPLKDSPALQEDRGASPLQGKCQKQEVAVGQSVAGEDHQGSHGSANHRERAGGSAVAGAKSGGGVDAQNQPETGRAKQAKRGRAALDLPPAVTRKSKRQAPPVSDTNPDEALVVCNETEVGGAHATAAAAQEDDFQDAPAKKLQQLEKGEGEGQKAGSGRAAAMQTRARDTAKRQLARQAAEGRDEKKGGQQPRRAGRQSLKQAAAQAAAKTEAKLVAKQEDLAFCKLFTAEAALPPPAGGSPSEQDAAEHANSLDEVPGTASVEAGEPAKPAAAAAQPRSQPPAAAGNAPGEDLLRRDPDGPSSADTPTASSDDRMKSTVLYQQHPEERQLEGVEMRRQNRQDEKLEEAEALTVPDTPHADLAPAQRRRSSRTPLPGPGGTPGAAEKMAAASGSPAALSVMDINALGARLAAQVSDYAQSLPWFWD